mmetsp:Transcript_24875/g.67731  ORF Transcript_24875/g.67731 Transcript_24875/m.67731 type:complete len:127 (-) Transcript_24875:879-1259(-)|eukprot:CAMPEP_0202351164 /NCGR_PEP_ID=MMETSP1126-20121109/7928_1 /ASSEMBLY_ACC=CAM_ASM_000457 /TAXON_ID=3047 /ORGANISM="Dunaliella tertiolecta, Strain CCMP1320" /LENGTH=126 /DNA_ID=CAMNT_0048943245 /DNA_START=95 /DNA_END=475 /DNA_ORIENTATION=+
MLQCQNRMLPRVSPRPTLASTTAIPSRSIIHRSSRSARLLQCRASEEPPKTEQPKVEQQPTQAPPPPTAAQQQEADKPLILQSGQGTAIVTGSISIIFGVAYLALVFLMDWRGGEMLPPPPEAFGP